MKSSAFFSIAGVLACAAGCGPLAYTARTVVLEPWEYCRTWSSFQEKRRDHDLAETALEAAVRAVPEHTFSEDYAAGFMEGYSDYLYAGGNGEPPPLPPRRYWRPRYETDEGRVAIQDWFAGYRHGADDARQSGYRNVVRVPASSPPLSETPGLNPIISGPPKDFTGFSFPPTLGEQPVEGPPVPVAPEPALPLPRKVPAVPGPVKPGSEAGAPETGASQVDQAPGGDEQ
jgi:hypothetical protein